MMTEAKSRSLFYGFLASIGLNILFVGLAVGLFLHGPHMMGHPGGPPPPGFGGEPPHSMVEHMTRGMSAADAEVIKQAFGDIKGPMGDHPPGPPPGGPMGDRPPGPPPGGHPPHELDAERKHVQELLVAPTLDSAALAAALDAEAAKRATFEASIRTAFLTAAPKLSLEGRRQLVHNFDEH
jgi:hypothetical protein